MRDALCALIILLLLLFYFVLLMIINPGTDGFIVNGFIVAHSERMAYGTVNRTMKLVYAYTYNN